VSHLQVSSEPRQSFGPVVLRVAVFPPGAVFAPARRGCRPARKIQDRETLSFQCIPQTPLRPPPPGRLSSLHPPPPSTPWPAPRSAVPCLRTAAWSGDGAFFFHFLWFRERYRAGTQARFGLECGITKSIGIIGSSGRASAVRVRPSFFRLLATCFRLSRPLAISVFLSYVRRANCVKAGPLTSFAWGQRVPRRVSKWVSFGTRLEPRHKQGFALSRFVVRWNACGFDEITCRRLCPAGILGGRHSLLSDTVSRQRCARVRHGSRQQRG